MAVGLGPVPGLRTLTALVVGIDPGVTGAIAAVSLHGEFVSVADLQVARHKSAAWIDGGGLIEAFADLREKGRIVTVLLEQAAVLKGQGSGLTIGAVWGSLAAGVQIAGYQLQIVTPGQWKAAAGLTADKADSLHRARLLFPTAPLDRKKGHNRAEALCLAWYGARQLGRAAGAPEAEFSTWNTGGQR